MGGANSSDITYEEFMEQFEEVRMEYNSQFGEVRICRKKSDQNIFVMLKEKWFNNQEVFQAFK